MAKRAIHLLTPKGHGREKGQVPSPFQDMASLWALPLQYLTSKLQQGVLMPRSTAPPRCTLKPRVTEVNLWGTHC